MSGLEIVEKIEAVLKEKGMKKGEFYSLCEVSSASLSQWRLGRHLPEHSTLMRINERLGTNFDFSDSNEKAAAPEGSGLTATQRVLIEKVKLMTDAEAEAFLALLNTFEARRKGQDAR